MEQIVSDRLFFEASGGGVTFSGGECMLQLDFLKSVLEACKRENIHTAVDTAGHVPRKSFERIEACTDLFLYDVKCFSSALHKEWTGVDNDLILSNLKWLLERGKEVWIRIPVIPSVNDKLCEMEGIKSFLESCAKKPARVELLPYHAMGEHKYHALGREVQSFAVPAPAVMEELNALFTFNG